MSACRRDLLGDRVWKLYRYPLAPAPAQAREEAAGAARRGPAAGKGVPLPQLAHRAAAKLGTQAFPCIFTAAPASLVVNRKGERRPLVLDV